MAASAAGDGLELLSRPAALEMAQEAGAVGHLEVVAHDHLGVAGGAAQLAAPAQALQVRAVVEADAHRLVRDQSLEEPRGVAARAQAGGVFHLGERLGGVGARDVLDHLRDGLELVPDHGPRAGRRIVALDAGDVAVLGVRPRLPVRLHDVAGAAEARALRVLHEPEEPEEGGDGAR